MSESEQDGAKPPVPEPARDDTSRVDDRVSQPTPQGRPLRESIDGMPPRPGERRLKD